MWAKRFGVWVRSRSHGTARVEWTGAEVGQVPPKDAWQEPPADNEEFETLIGRLAAEQPEPVEQEA